MSQTVPIEQAAAKLAELVGMLKPGDEIVLTDHDHPVARIIASGSPRFERHAGNCKGMLIVHQEDDSHLEDFGDYVPS